MSSNPSLIGRVLAGRYRIDSRRGAGDHGIVLDGFDLQLERVVAVKALLPHYASTTAAEARFRFEAQAAASLTHPNLNAVFDWGVEDVDGTPLPYLVLEHLGGGSLRDILDRGRLLSPSQALAVGLDVCRGLDYMHRRGVIHRGLNPGNLVFGDDRHVRILDVGLSRLFAEETWSEPSAAGIDAARYASPEQGLGGSPQDGTLDAATDIYSLTLVLIEAVTGQVPFASDSTVATLNARVDKLMPVSADLGPLASVLSRAGSAIPGDRYTAAEFGRALVQAAEKLPRPAPIPIVGTSLLGDNTGGLRRPTDPTGPARRPEEPTEAVALVGTIPPPPQGPLSTAPPESQESAFTGSTVLLPLVTNDSPPPPPPPPVMSNEPGLSQAPAPPPATIDVVTGPLADGVEPPIRPSLYDEGPAEPKRRRKLWILAVILVLAALAAGAVIVYQQLKDTSYAVPDLVGVEEAKARNEVAGHGWTIVVSRERNDDQPLDFIIRTDPPAGTMLKEGEPITFVVSDGPTLSTLPDVTGQDLATATATLAASNLDIVVGQEVYDETIPAGTVMSWNVPAQPNLTTGMEVMQHTVVSVTVSKGPTPRQVPQLIGLDPAAAQAAMDQQQLVLQRDPADVFSSTYPAGVVADQSLPPGTEIQRGETVTIAVSKGPDVVTMPALESLPYDQVVAALTNAGFVVGAVDGPSTGFLSDVQVGGLHVTTGQQFPRGTTVNLFYT